MAILNCEELVNKKLTILIFMYTLSASVVLFYKWNEIKKNNGEFDLVLELSLTFLSIIILPLVFSAFGNESLSKYFSGSDNSIYDYLILLSYISIGIFGGRKIIKTIMSSFFLPESQEEIMKTRKETGEIREAQEIQGGEIEEIKRFHRALALVGSEDFDTQLLSTMKEILSSEDGRLLVKGDKEILDALKYLSHKKYILTHTTENDRRNGTLKCEITSIGKQLMDELESRSRT